MSDPESDMEVEQSLASADESSSEGFIPVVNGKRKRAAKNKTPAPPPKAIALSASTPASPSPSPTPRRAPCASAASAQPAVSAAGTGGESARKEKSPPPVFLRDKARWDYISKVMLERHITYNSASNTQQGIKISVPTSDDHRALTKFLRDENVGYHTYALEEEKLLYVILRGIPQEIDTGSVKADLVGQSLPVKDVHRMYSGRNKTPFDLVLVSLERSRAGKAIFNIKTVLGLSGISVEVPHRKGLISQCHRCQLYGHVSRYCNARPRCVKCLGDHSTTECSRPRDTTEPPSCVLCGTQGHTANYRGCPKAPRGAKRPAVSRPPLPSRNPGGRPKLNVAPAAPPATFKLAPAPVVNAWSKPLGMVQNHTVIRPSAPTDVVQNHTVIRPSNHTVIRPSAPTTIPAPPKATAADLGMSDLQSDLALVMDFARAVNVAEIRTLAQKIRAATNLNERVKLTLEHADCISALQHYSPSN